MTKPHLTRFERWVAWLLCTPRGQFVLVLACTGFLALCVGADELARERGRGSVFAPEGQDVWRGIQFGAALGALLMIFEGLLSVPRVVISPCDPAKNWEPTGWRLCVLYASLGCQCVWASVVLLTLFWWCGRSGFALIPPFCAMYVILISSSMLWRMAFGAPAQDKGSEPVRAEN